MLGRIRNTERLILLINFSTPIYPIADRWNISRDLHKHTRPTERWGNSRDLHKLATESKTERTLSLVKGFANP